MKWPTWVLVALLIALQYPLWFGKGGWLRVRDMENQLAAQRDVNQTLEVRNASQEAEVRDLKSGYEAIEERARYELGLVKEGEVFVQTPHKPPGGGAEQKVGAGGTASKSIPATRSAR